MSITSIGDLLQGYVLADNNIANTLTGSDGLPRFYPYRIPQKPTLPAADFQCVSGLRISSQRGPASAGSPLYQIRSWGKTKAEAISLGSAIRQRLEGFVGYWTGDGSPPTLSVFTQVEFVSEEDEFVEDILGGLEMHLAEYRITHDTLGGTL